MPKFYFNRIVPTGITASQIDAAYPPQNASLPSLSREYRSTNLSGAQFFNFEFGQLRKMAGVFASGLNSDYANLFYYDAANTFRIANCYAMRDGFNRAKFVDFAKQNVTGADFYAKSLNFLLNGYITQTFSVLTYTTSVQNPATQPSRLEYRSIKNSPYVIATGDVLRYDVWRDPANPDAAAGGIELNLTTTPFNGRAIPLNDQFGALLVFGPASATNNYVSRTISLAGAVGKTLAEIQLVNESDVAGKHVAKYRNIRITNAAGTVDNFVIWRGGRTDVDTPFLQQYTFGKIDAQGDTTDGAGFWRLGQLFAFSDVIQLAPAPDKNYIADYAHAQQSQKIINGNTAVWGVGATRREISLEWLRKYPEQLQTVLTETRKGICVLDMENPLMPENVWPVMCLDERLGSRFPRNNSEILSGMKLTEVC